MDLEDIENDLYESKKLQSLGYMDLNHFCEHRHCVIQGLSRFGDCFAAALGMALNKANVDDSIKIIRYWNHLCETNALMYKMYVAKHKTEVLNE